MCVNRHLISPTVQCGSNSLSVFIVSTYTDGRPPEGGAWFCDWIVDAADDFRVQKTILQGLRYAVFGLGDSLYREDFNKVCIPCVFHES